MIVIEQNSDPNFTDIIAIAQEVWPKTYGAILGQAQLDYMMDMMYSVASLQKQANEKQHHFILAKENEMSVGFASYEFDCNGTHKTKIHKIYILSTQQGKGIGRFLLDYIANEAQKHNNIALFLNVNKYNPAQHFYKKLGFDITKEEVIDIGQGYVMDDYVMEKKIN
ncbi:GNAT family N-acetyltransferase [Flavobacterium sp. IMCC34852]|uniref:GNAT family N-acetyltransferase n=1 Tax=Flavobacterium rivulicola TaxID=2732161 RepID=A0A7Y3VYK9_9FLAO|nr:GNAT family N-acetyltransferase [Flavobacterium sp. IMCC34852]NNT71805.1 GNAT family N-acetyltransferase [Flavobacterium sp. IMCC34852]